MNPVAEETLRIVREGRYLAPSGAAVEIGEEVRAAKAGTVVYAPGDVVPRDGDEGAKRFEERRISVTAETTAAAGRRLFEAHGVACVLNFASARNPGGGFLGGARAQEEDLARASALYDCLLEARAYYDANRAERSVLYTDHVIFSPRVPFFRGDDGTLTERAALLSVITAPAPNAGAIKDKERTSLVPTLERRAAIVLEVAARNAQRHLVLGAWGCGVFRNDPKIVADIFARALEGRFAGAFEEVVFAVWDRSRERNTLKAFEERFAST